MGHSFSQGAPVQHCNDVLRCSCRPKSFLLILHCDLLDDLRICDKPPILKLSCLNMGKPQSTIRNIVQLKELYRYISVTLPGLADPPNTVAAIGDFITIEDHCSSSLVSPVRTQDLLELTYSVVDTLKWRRLSLVKLRQADGEMFWVESDNLAANAMCLNMHEPTERYTYAQHMMHASLQEPQREPFLVVDSPEPVSLLIGLGVAPQHDVYRGGNAPPRLLLVTGVTAAGKTEILAFLEAWMPERLVKVMHIATAPLHWTTDVDIITDAEFDAYVQQGALLYAVDHPCQFAGIKGVRWGLLKEVVDMATRGTKGVFVAIEEHPLGVAAMRAAGIDGLVVHVTLPGVDIHDQRLRLSSKQYGEQQVCFLYLPACSASPNSNCLF
jgi:hypothetical protein